MSSCRIRYSTLVFPAAHRSNQQDTRTERVVHVCTVSVGQPRSHAETEIQRSALARRVPPSQLGKTPLGQTPRPVGGRYPRRLVALVPPELPPGRHLSAVLPGEQSPRVGPRLRAPDRTLPQGDGRLETHRHLPGNLPIQTRHQYLWNHSCRPPYWCQTRAYRLLQPGSRGRQFLLRMSRTSLYGLDRHSSKIVRRLAVKRVPDYATRSVATEPVVKRRLRAEPTATVCATQISYPSLCRYMMMTHFERLFDDPRTDFARNRCLGRLTECGPESDCLHISCCPVTRCDRCLWVDYLRPGSDDHR
jgi:hypothetical protein